MAICREFYYSSSDGSSRIHAAEWTPENQEIIGVLQIAHGVAEYGMRYAPFAEFMTEHGFAVVANDHLGHGLSAEKDADTLYFGPRDGWMHVVDDMYALRCRTKEKYPDVPYFLMGHSMGSFLTRTYLIRYPGTVDAAIIMGTGHQSPAVVAGGRAIAGAAGRRHGFDAHSPRVENLAFGAYNKANANGQVLFAMKVDGVEANEENIISGDYTVQRPVMFVTGAPVTESEQAFIDYVFSQTGYDVVVANGYIPAFTPAA